MSPLWWVFVMIVTFALFYGFILIALKGKLWLAVISTIFLVTAIMQLDPTKARGIEMFYAVFFPILSVILGTIIGLALNRKKKKESKSVASA